MDFEKEKCRLELLDDSQLKSEADTYGQKYWRSIKNTLEPKTFDHYSIIEYQYVGTDKIKELKKLINSIPDDCDIKLECRDLYDDYTDKHIAAYSPIPSEIRTKIIDEILERKIGLHTTKEKERKALYETLKKEFETKQ